MSALNVLVSRGTDILVSWPWNFWIFVVSVGLLVWLMVWVVKRYNHNPKARETLYRADELEQDR